MKGLELFLSSWTIIQKLWNIEKSNPELWEGKTMTRTLKAARVFYKVCGCIGL